MIRPTLLIVAALLSACSGGGNATSVPAAAETLPPTAYDLNYPNPPEEAGQREVIRFAVEWRIVKRGEPIYCGGTHWLGGCTHWVPGETTCVVVTSDPIDWNGKTEAYDHEQRLAMLGHEIAAHCAHQMSDQEWAEAQP